MTYCLVKKITFRVWQNCNGYFFSTVDTFLNMYRFWYRRYFLDRCTRYFGNFFLSKREQKRKTFRVFPQKASSTSTAKPRCCRSVVGNYRAAAPREVCYRSVRVFRINALNLKHTKLVSCIFILLSRESDQCAVRARFGVAGHLSTTPRWGNPVKCLSQRHNK